MSITITNKYGLPQPIYDALTHDSYTRGDSDRSITQLIDSPRIRILSAEYNDRIEVDASEQIWKVLGTAVHKMFEEQAAGSETHVAEQRMFAEVEGWKISGAIDLLHEAHDGNFVLQDYKTCSIWSVIYGKIEWERQLNCYAWLAEVNDFAPVSKLQVVAIMRDWNQRDAGNKKDYPEAPIMLIDIPLWSFDERDEYVRERVGLHQDAEFLRLVGDELPLCTDEERWLKPTTWAVKKKGNKRALKLYDNLDDAQAHVDASDAPLVVEERPGEATRCQQWCRVAPWCNQWQEDQDNAGT